MPYDYNLHAGNQGDVVKHPALMAALDSVIADSKKPRIRYADPFAGHAGSILVPGNQWTQGVGKVDRNPDNVANKNVQLWLQWYLSRPSLTGTLYPSSPIIATDIAAAHSKDLHLTAWDTSEDAAQSLRAVLKSPHVIHERSAEPKEPAIQEADFLFVDPPGIQSRRNRAYPSWPTLLELLAVSPKLGLLAWLPINVAVVNGKARESVISSQRLNQALQIPGTSATAVVWARAGRTIGCQLIYRLPPTGVTAVRAAVESVVDISNWSTEIIRPYN